MHGLCKTHTGHKGWHSTDSSGPCPSLPPAELLPASPPCLYSAGRLEGPLLGPQELDSWLVGTVRALQESMRDAQGRLQRLESMPVPAEQVSPL